MFFMKPITLPACPNSPITFDQKQAEGYLQLKFFGSFNFLYNDMFEEGVINYDENYHNEQGYSELFQNHLNQAYELIKNNNFQKGIKLVDVGCGKGKFLEIVNSDSFFKYEGYDNAYEGNDKHIFKRFLTEKDRVSADIVVLRHTLEHIKSPYSFLKSLNIIFGNDAVIFIEVPQFDWIRENKVLFDFTYEHVNYFTTESLCSFFTKVIDCGNFFGGQYQYCMAKLGDLSNKEWENFENANKSNFDIEEYYDQFKLSVNFLNNKKRIWVWGGGTKGVLFLKHLADLQPIFFNKVAGVVDISPGKQTFFTPSTKVRIISDKQMYEELKDDDVILVVNPNYYKEIKEAIAIASSKKIEVFNI